MNRSLPLLLLALSTWLLTGCPTNQQAFFTSPFNGAANDCHPLPQVIDGFQPAIGRALDIMKDTRLMDSCVLPRRAQE